MSLIYPLLKSRQNNNKNDCTTLYTDADTGIVVADRHVEEINTTIYATISGCSDGDYLVNITTAVANIIDTYLSDDTCDFPTDPNPCLYGGVATADGMSFTCDCPDGFSGDYCENGSYQLDLVICSLVNTKWYVAETDVGG